MKEKTKKTYSVTAAVFLIISALISLSAHRDGEIFESYNILFIVNTITSVILAIVLFTKKRGKPLFICVALQYGISVLSSVFSIITYTVNNISLIKDGMFFNISGVISILFDYLSIICSLISYILIIVLASSLINENKREALSKKKKIVFAPAALSAAGNLIPVLSLFISLIAVEIRTFFVNSEFNFSIFKYTFKSIISIGIGGVISFCILLFLARWIVFGDNNSADKESAAANAPAQPYDNQYYTQNQQQYYNNTDYTQNQQQYYNNQYYTQNPQQYYNNQGYAQNQQQYYNNPDYTQVLRQPDNNQTYAQNPPQTPDEN